MQTRQLVLLLLLGTLSAVAHAQSASCSAAVGDYCGNAQGSTCCPTGSYCQPWNEYYYQCIAVEDGCGSMETDVDYYGNDLTSIQTSYPWTCCDLCQSTSGCVAYTFWNQDPSGPTCYLKSSATGRVSKTGAVSGVVVATPTPTTGAPLVCGTQLKNIYYHGFDLATYNLTTADACCLLCASYSGCNLYTHFISSTTGQHTCYLKSAEGEKTNYADGSSVTAVSGIMVSSTAAPTSAPTPTPTPTPTSDGGLCQSPIANVFYNDYTLFEFELETAAECCEYCAEYDECVLYSLYVSTSDKVYRCLLKTAAGSTTTYAPAAGLTVQSAFKLGYSTPTPTPSGCAVQGGNCGSAQGSTCCASGSYCQPWNEYYYQCIAVEDGCSSMETDVDYYGNDLTSIQTPYPWTCCDLCQSTSGCVAYTFYNQDPNGPTCYLKSSKSGKTTKVGAVSGSVA